MERKKVLAGEQDEMDAVLSKRTVIQLSGRGPSKPLLRAGHFEGVGWGGVGWGWLTNATPERYRRIVAELEK